MRRSVAHVLRSLGHEVEEAENGEIAISRLRVGNYHLLITDILMPEKDGGEVIDFVKSQTNRPRIIAMSGGGSQSTANQAIDKARSHADGILLKPFNRQDIVSLVEKLLVS